MEHPAIPAILTFKLTSGFIRSFSELLPLPLLWRPWGIDDAEQQHFNWHSLPRVLLKNGGATPLAKTATGTGKKVGKGLRGSINGCIGCMLRETPCCRVTSCKLSRNSLLKTWNFGFKTPRSVLCQIRSLAEAENLVSKHLPLY